MNVGCAHRHKDPLTALAIGVSSSADLSVEEQETTEAAPKETIARLFPSKGMYQLRPLHSRNHRITCLHTPISGIRHYNRYFTTHSHTIPSAPVVTNNCRTPCFSLRRRASSVRAATRRSLPRLVTPADYPLSG